MQKVDLYMFWVQAEDKGEKQSKTKQKQKNWFSLHILVHAKWSGNLQDVLDLMVYGC